jgi:CheY-like chemotaxis protein
MGAAICHKEDFLLVTDDEEIIAEMIGELVEELGCAHIAFSRPLEALEYYKANSPRVSLLIADARMPDLSGPDLIRKALEINPDLSTILLVNYVGESIPDDISRLAKRILLKPFTQAELRDAVQAALGRERGLAGFHR